MENIFSLSIWQCNKDMSEESSPLFEALCDINHHWHCLVPSPRPGEGIRILCFRRSRFNHFIKCDSYFLRDGHVVLEDRLSRRGITSELFSSVQLSLVSCPEVSFCTRGRANRTVCHSLWLFSNFLKQKKIVLEWTEILGIACDVLCLRPRRRSLPVNWYFPDDSVWNYPTPVLNPVRSKWVDQARRSTPHFLSVHGFVTAVLASTTAPPPPMLTPPFC